ncbi:MAG: hypothetical protein P8Y78_04165 [Acidihalobacter sp.]
MLGDTSTTLCCRQVIPLARAFGDFVSPHGDHHFAIGYDVRESSPSLAEAVSMGLRSGGHHVTHIGACTAPRLQWYVAEEKFDGAIMLTGGKAPPQWNGMQFYTADAVPVSAAELLESLHESDLNHLFDDRCTNVLHQQDPLQAYAAQLRQRFKPAAQFKLCLDAGNGLVGREVEAIVAHYRHLRLWRIAFKPDSAFPAHGTDPFAPAALEKAAQCVLGNGCDVGAIIDADGETLAIVDEHGAAVAPAALGALLSLRLAPSYPGRHVLLAPEVPAQIRNILAEAGIPTRIFDGGPLAAYAALRGDDASFYFDESGHYASCDFPSASNALLALLELINHLTETNHTLSRLLADMFPPSAREPSRHRR